MKSIMNTLALILLIAFPAIMMAQPASPTPVPIDGGASILAAAGIAYGIKKYRDMKKIEQD